MTENNTATIPNVLAPAFPSLAALKAAHIALLQQHHASGETPEFLSQADAFIRQGQATGALLDAQDDRWTAQSLLDYWANVLYRAGQIPPDATLAEFDITLSPELDDALCPYRGLDVFREADHAHFFGRQRLIEEMLAFLRKDRLLFVVGSSGSGKSSLVRAGLVPALEAGAIPGSRTWRYLPPMVPGSDPLANLARVTQPGGVSAAQWVRQEKTSYLQDTGHLAKRLAEESAPALLIVDQFEEVFTLCDDDQARQAFIGNLLTLAAQPDTPHTIILTMRVDFESNVARVPALQSLYEHSQVRMTALNAGELRQAVEKPAEMVGLKFEQGVVEALLQDILGEPAALPLLQFTLLKLWENRDHNRVTWETYRRLGGGRLALARSADAFYDGLIPEEQVTAKRILLRMVRPSEGLEVTSNRIRRESIYQAGEARDRVDRVLDKLLKARLVRLTRGESATDDQLEVAHEALVRNWPRLVDWLEDERVAMRQRLRLASAAQHWKETGRDASALWRGALLDEAMRYGDLNELEAEFVQASRAAVEEAEREKEAAHERELAQARALAEEQQRRAQVERQRAEEQAKSSKNTRRLATLAVTQAVVSALLFIVIIVGYTTKTNLATGIAFFGMTCCAFPLAVVVIGYAVSLGVFGRIRRSKESR
jgi:uncharacterized integral membrane protein